MKKTIKDYPYLVRALHESAALRKKYHMHFSFRFLGNGFASSVVILLIAIVTDFLKAHPERVGQRQLTKPPGSLLLFLGDFLFPKKFFWRVVVRVVSDMREEYFEALSQNRIWKARWVRIRGTYSFFAAIGLDRAFAFVSFFIKAWKSVN